MSDVTPNAMTFAELKFSQRCGFKANLDVGLHDVKMSITMYIYIYIYNIGHNIFNKTLISFYTKNTRILLFLDEHYTIKTVAF